jgi:ABC-type amino acid transport substrate-binding protein
VDDAIAALVNGEVEAVVYDAPNLLYYANGEGKGKFMVVGKIFEPQGYGLALPQGSILRKKINLAILELIESGEYERIKMKWFGD